MTAKSKTPPSPHFPLRSRGRTTDSGCGKTDHQQHHQAEPGMFGSHQIHSMRESADRCPVWLHQLAHDFHQTDTESFDTSLLFAIFQSTVRVKCFVGFGHGDLVGQDDHADVSQN